MVNDKYIEQVRAIALRNIMEPDWDGVLRTIYRFYSKTFSTPLHQVPDLPLYDVLLAYFEEQYEGMEGPARHEEILKLVEGVEAYSKRLEAEEADEEAYLEQVVERQRMEAERQLEEQRQMVEQVEAIKSSLGGMADALEGFTIDFSRMPMPAKRTPAI